MHILTLLSLQWWLKCCTLNIDFDQWESSQQLHGKSKWGQRSMTATQYDMKYLKLCWCCRTCTLSIFMRYYQWPWFIELVTVKYANRNAIYDFIFEGSSSNICLIYHNFKLPSEKMSMRSTLTFRMGQGQIYIPTKKANIGYHIWWYNNIVCPVCHYLQDGNVEPCGNVHDLDLDL